MNQVFLYITAADADEARKIGRDLVAQRLAACANILPGITSIYRWQGEVAEDGEIAMIVKTRRELIDAVVDRVRTLHSYDCPCVVALPVQGGNPEFLKWIIEETS